MRPSHPPLGRPGELMGWRIHSRGPAGAVHGSPLQPETILTGPRGGSHPDPAPGGPTQHTRLHTPNSHELIIACLYVLAVMEGK